MTDTSQDVVEQASYIATFILVIAIFINELLVLYYLDSELGVVYPEYQGYDK